MPTPSLHFDKGTLLVRGLQPEEAPRIDDWPCRWDDRVGAWRTEAIRYVRLARRLRRLFPDSFVDEVPLPEGVVFDNAQTHELRPEQREAVDAWQSAGFRGQIVMPTGTGKTVVALAAIELAKTATLVVAPVRDLMYQWHRRILSDLGVDAGIVGDGQYTLRPVCVTTYDSAYIHMAELGDRFGLIVFDEEHHLPGPCRREAALLSAAPMRLGLTATPWRSDGRHADLDELIGPVVYEFAFDTARRTRLAEFDVVRIPVHLTDEEQADYDRCGKIVQSYMIEKNRQSPGFSWQDVGKAMGDDPAARHAMNAFHRKKAIEDRAAEKLRVLEDIFRLHPDKKTIVFAGSNRMAMAISRRFLLPTILSHTPKRERLAVLDGFASGEFPAIVANQVLDEGVDVPAAKVAVVVGGQATPKQAQQRLGRILRRSGDERAVLYEVVSETTGEANRSRKRRKSDAYRRTRYRKL
mgnify:FL=1